jgi:hypothetical protein
MGRDRSGCARHVCSVARQQHSSFYKRQWTARASCYFVLCLKAGGWLPKQTILPELIRQNRQEYVDALQIALDAFAAGALNIAPLHAFVSRLLAQQLGARRLCLPAERHRNSPLGWFVESSGPCLPCYTRCWPRQRRDFVRQFQINAKVNFYSEVG